MQRRPGLLLGGFPWGIQKGECITACCSFDIRRAEPSRDGRSDGAHALPPAGIFSRTVQLGAPPETPRQRPFSLVLDSRLEPSGPALVPPRTQAHPKVVIAIGRSRGTWATSAIANSPTESDRSDGLTSSVVVEPGNPSTTDEVLVGHHPVPLSARRLGSIISAGPGA